MQHSFLSIMNHIGEFIRWRDWGPGKVSVFCIGLLYIGLAYHQLSTVFVFDFILFIIFITLQASLGYVLNDWGDRKVDIEQGKTNAFTKLSHVQGIMALGALCLLAFISGLPFVGRPMVLPLWIALVFLSIAYSLKPLRLKEHGAIGLVAAALAQWPLPIMLTFAVLNRFGGWDMIVFSVALTVSGATLEIAHQRFDRLRDISTQTATLGARMRTKKLNRLFSIALFLDKIALSAILVTITVGIKPVTIGNLKLSAGCPLLAIYALLFSFALYEANRSLKRGELLDPYYSSGRSASKLLHETLPNLIIPLYLMLLAAIYQPQTVILLFAFVLWRLVLGKADLLWPFRAFKAFYRN
jgi:1,4-dihydroxy-2-naphthoate octaprenyltransferase